MSLQEWHHVAMCARYFALRDRLNGLTLKDNPYYTSYVVSKKLLERAESVASSLLGEKSYVLVYP